MIWRRRQARTPDPVCRAPFSSLHLDQHGDARPCCRSTLVIGNVRDQSLAAIQSGPVASDLREAILRGDLSLGCEFCAHAARNGDHSSTYARRFDDLPMVDAGSPPVQLEIALSNTCNLQCTMCNGEWSSAIRSQREHLPPLPKAYSDAFFDELAGHLGALRRVELYGGEPFLGREPLRLLELLVEQAPQVEVAVTTNGTIWNDRVARLMEALRISIMVSVDGATRGTYESIRVGASWDDVTRNIERFRAACKVGGTRFGLAHCLMVQNWHEFPEMVAWAASLGADLFVNTVDYPLEVSLFALPPDELRGVVAALEAREGEVRSLPRDWGAVWSDELGRLRRHLDDLDDRDTEGATPVQVRGPA